MAPKPYTAPPPVSSTSIFQPNIFQGKVLFCTGGGSGICRGMTEAVMRHGADAVIVGRKLDRLTTASKELSATTGRKCLPAQADVRDPKSLKEAVEKTVKEFGRIDFVICGAAGNFLAPITGLSENAFRTVMEIDTIGTYNTIKATLSHVQKTNGSYIHVSATLHYQGTVYQAHVSAAKAGVDALSRVLAVEAGPAGIRSNVIAPGAIVSTEGAARLFRDGAKYPTPLGRLGEIEDVANVTVWLFSDAASYVTGQVIVVDGGQEHCRSGVGMMGNYPQGLLEPVKARL